MEENYNKRLQIDKASVEKFANDLNNLKKSNVGFCEHEQKVLKDCLANNSETPLTCSDEVSSLKLIIYLFHIFL